jgi:GNAT superfamily N-acetyltransferase
MACWLDPACTAAVTALEHDPFYRSIAVEFAGDNSRRRAALGAYFAYCIEEGSRMGRTAHLDDPRMGVAVWLFPQSGDIRQREALRKRRFLQKTLGAAGSLNYDRIVEYMHSRAQAIIPREAWYLSIIAIAPEAQGQGLGRLLLGPTLAEADAAGAVCYLETFSPRSLTFYERVGFSSRARIDEPTAQAAYTIMVRFPMGYLKGVQPHEHL